MLPVWCIEKDKHGLRLFKHSKIGQKLLSWCALQSFSSAELQHFQSCVILIKKSSVLTAATQMMNTTLHWIKLECTEHAKIQTSQSLIWPQTDHHCHIQKSRRLSTLHMYSSHCFADWIIDMQKSTNNRQIAVQSSGYTLEPDKCQMTWQAMLTKCQATHSCTTRGIQPHCYTSYW